MRVTTNPFLIPGVVLLKKGGCVISMIEWKKGEALPPEADEVAMCLSDYEDLRSPPMASGKWTEPDFPHKGWICTDVEDVGADREICQMCDTMEIRYVHIMQHPERPNEPLRVGCICAGNMEEDLIGARVREYKFKYQAISRNNWLGRHWVRRMDWRTNLVHECLNTSGFKISVWQENGAWHGKVVRPDGRVKCSKKKYDTADEVKLAAFDVMMAYRNAADAQKDQ